MNIASLWNKKRATETAAWPLAESPPLPVETAPLPERALGLLVTALQWIASAHLRRPVAKGMPCPRR
jgi:hypothetical protein